MYINEKINGFHFRTMIIDDKELFLALQSEANEVAEFLGKVSGIAAYQLKPCTK